jgi:hypothetical protein
VDYRIAGLTNSAPERMPVGQREVDSHRDREQGTG